MTTESKSTSTTPVQIVPIQKLKKVPATVTNDVAHKVNSLNTTSSRIRFLLKCGYKPGQIADILGIRYQWAYNVSNQKLKGPTRD